MYIGLRARNSITDIVDRFCSRVLLYTVGVETCQGSFAEGVSCGARGDAEAIQVLGRAYLGWEIVSNEGLQT